MSICLLVHISCAQLHVPLTLNMEMYGPHPMIPDYFNL